MWTKYRFGYLTVDLLVEASRQENFLLKIAINLFSIFMTGHVMEHNHYGLCSFYREGERRDVSEVVGPGAQLFP